MKRVLQESHGLACLFWNLLFFCCVSHQLGVSGKYLALGGTMGQGELGPFWGRGCWLPAICQKSQAGGFSQPTGLPRAAWQWVAWDIFTLHGPLKEHQDWGPMWPVGSLLWAAAPDWKSGFHKRLGECLLFPGAKGLRLLLIWGWFLDSVV